MMWERIRHGVRWCPGERFALAVRAINLKDVKQILISFDPFHPGNHSLRMFWQAIHAPKVRMTNPAVKVKAEIRNDKEPPFFVTNLANGKRLLFKTDGMPEADLVMQFNRLLGNPEKGKSGPWPAPKL